MDERDHPEGVADDDLVRAYQQDPESRAGREAVSELLGRWQGRVYRWVRRYVYEHEQALDLAQDCLVQAYQALPRYEPRGRFSAWLFTIVHHRCLVAVRRRPIVRDQEIDVDELMGVERAPEDRLETKDRQERVLTVMRLCLEPKERMALWLRAWEEMSLESITAVLGFDGATGARGVLQTARRKLRAALAESLPSRKDP